LDAAGVRGITLLLLVLLLIACQPAERIAEVGPKIVLPSEPRQLPTPVPVAQPQERPPLPPEQTSESYLFLPTDPDPAGWRQFRVKIGPGGSPSLVALEKLTPLFQVEGKGPVQYVTEAFFATNPHRTPRSIQPGDEFLLRVPPDQFVVRWQEEREEDVDGRTLVREYVSDRGDRLTLYLADRFPILYELSPADGNGQAQLRFHADLAFMLGSGRLDELGLARLIFRVQVGATAVHKQVGTHLDPIRQAMLQASIIERVPEPELRHLTRAVFVREEVAPYLAIEDALGTQPDISQLKTGQVFRIEYGRDGVVRVSYLTGDDDERGKRDPYELRDNERWAGIYGTYLPGDASPVGWGPGEPSDIPPFPTARDPNRRVLEGERSYDYLLAGRAVMYTFRPTRTRADLRTETEFGQAMAELSKQYKTVMSELQALIPELRR
jgi:hypothetical protein